MKIIWNEEHLEITLIMKNKKEYSMIKKLLTLCGGNKFGTDR